MRLYLYLLYVSVDCPDGDERFFLNGRVIPSKEALWSVLEEAKQYRGLYYETSGTNAWFHEPLVSAFSLLFCQFFQIVSDWCQKEINYFV